MNLKALLASAAIALAPLSALAQAVAPVGDNLLVNPWMELDQDKEGASITVTRQAAGTFALVDYIPLGDGNWNGYAAQSSSSSPTVLMQNAAAAPNGSIADLKWTQNASVSTTHADGTLVTIEQRIEPARIAQLQYGTANAQGSYLQFCAKASVAGTYGFYIAGGTSARTSDIAAGTAGSSYFKSFSIPTANQFSCYDFYIPGDTGGTWLATTTTVDATHGATLGFVLAINGVTTATYGVPDATHVDGAWANDASHAGAAANVIGNNSTYVALDKSASATFELTGVKWSLDNQPLAHEPGFELIQAQRYFAKTFNAGVGGNAGTAPAQNSTLVGSICMRTASATAATAGAMWNFPVAMRAAPTITTFNPAAANAKWRDVTGSGDVTQQVDVSTAKGTQGAEIGTVTDAMTAAHDLCIGAQADARL